MQYVNTSEAPAPLGHYAQAVVSDGLVYVSGQLPNDPKTGEVLSEASAATQARQVLANCQAILRAAGSELGQTLSLTFYVVELDSWAEVDAVAAEMFGAHRPSRSVIAVSKIRKGCKVQANLIARTFD